MCINDEICIRSIYWVAFMMPDESGNYQNKARKGLLDFSVNPFVNSLHLLT
jgi:hypothetical protein